MKIAICTLGSRGDIQPFLVLGQYLNQNGHDVKVASAEMYKPLADNYDVHFQSFDGDYESLVDDEALKKEIGRNPFTVGRELKERVYPIIENSLETFYELLLWSDIVVYHPKTLIDGIGEKFKHKLIKAYVVPMFTPTKEFTNPILSFLPFPKFLNKSSYWFTDLAVKSFSQPIKNFRKKNNIQQKKISLKTAVLYGLSPSVIEKPKDYPKNAHFTGFWMEKVEEQQLSSNLISFVSDEAKVLLITFGSMPYKSDIDINKFIEAILETTNLKVLIVKGWGLKEIEIIESKMVMTIDSAPFDLLFPKIDLIIHHGGAGTTAIALKSALPQLITPVLYPFGDQFFWGIQLQKNGVGVRPIPLKKLSIASIKDSVKNLVADDLKSNAQILSTKIKEENGLLKAKELIEKHYAQRSVYSA